MEKQSPVLLLKLHMADISIHKLYEVSNKLRDEIISYLKN